MYIGNVDHPYLGAVVVHQCDIDRKLAVTFDELLGPVERIDHPEEIPVAPLLVEQVAPLFAQQRDMGRPQVAFDQRMGFAVGQCDRCPVALEVHFDIHPVVVNIKNARTCTKRCIVCLYQEKFGLLACQHGLRFCM